MASLTRSPPPLLRPSEVNGGGANRPFQLSPLGPNQSHLQSHTINKDKDCFPRTPAKTRDIGATPMNTPAFKTIAPRLNLGGGNGRPIGGGIGYGKVAHAATPGNTPSSLETMGKRIAGRLSGSGPVSPTEVKETGASAIAGGARIAPSYE
jgi:hypothetical protein